MSLKENEKFFEEVWESTKYLRKPFRDFVAEHPTAEELEEKDKQLFEDEDKLTVTEEDREFVRRHDQGAYL